MIVVESDEPFEYDVPESPLNGWVVTLKREYSYFNLTSEYVSRLLTSSSDRYVDLRIPKPVMIHKNTLFSGAVQTDRPVRSWELVLYIEEGISDEMYDPLTDDWSPQVIYVYPKEECFFESNHILLFSPVDGNYEDFGKYDIELTFIGNNWKETHTFSPDVAYQLDNRSWYTFDTIHISDWDQVMFSFPVECYVCWQV